MQTAEPQALQECTANAALKPVASSEVPAKPADSQPSQLGENFDSLMKFQNK